MNFDQVENNEFVDLFGVKPVTKPDFSVQGFEESSDLWETTTTPAETVTEPKEETVTTTTTATEEKPVEGAETTDPKEEIDILQEEETRGRKPKYDFSDINGYFQDRFKSNVLIPLVDEEDKPLELKTPEDFDRVISENINYQVQQKSKELEDNWFKNQKPAFQAVAKYAQSIENVTDLIPFIQGVQNIQSVANVDENTPEGAEAIVRFYKESSGTPSDLIDVEIESLKTSDKLQASAAKLKPVILKVETQRLQKMQQEAEAQEVKYWQMVQDYEKTARSVIQQPLFGSKLKQEEQAEIYNMIAIPNEELGGYAIYNEIDSLYEKKDFETLRKIAYLLKKEENFLKFASQKAVTETASKLQKQVRLATTPKAASGSLSDPDYANTPRIKVSAGNRTFGKAGL